MRLRQQLVTPVMIVALAAGPVGLSACASHQTYDQYHSDYHRWDGSENAQYRRWEGETGKGHVNFDRRTAEEQHAYYDWRHRQ